MNIREYSEISDILKNKNPEEFLICLEKEKSFADALDQISAINMERAVKISGELSAQYKRRTSLTKMIFRFEK